MLARSSSADVEPLIKPQGMKKLHTLVYQLNKWNVGRGSAYRMLCDAVGSSAANELLLAINPQRSVHRAHHLDTIFGTGYPDNNGDGVSDSAMDTEAEHPVGGDPEESQVCHGDR